MIIFLILANGNDSRNVWKHAVARHYTGLSSAHLRRSLTLRATKTHKIDWLEQRKLQKYGANIMAHLTSFTYTEQVD